MAMPEKAWPFCIRSILSKMLCENCVGRIVQCEMWCGVYACKECANLRFRLFALRSATSMNKLDYG